MTTPQLCETVAGRTMAELLTARTDATRGDMIELRVDGVVDLDLGAALAGRRCPAIVTCRPEWEGGRYDGGETRRLALLNQALELGADYVDVEWRALHLEQADGFRALVRGNPARVVLSLHDFSTVPADLEQRVAAMRATGAGTIKVAVTFDRLSDTLRLRTLADRGRTVVVGMGERGVPTRLLAARYGSCWTYAGDGVAPGQLPARRMIEDFGFRRVGPATRVFGVVSTRALHSLSPIMHNAAFEASGLDAVYVPLPVEEFGDFLSFAAGMELDGASVTIPFKIDALQAADCCDEVTRRVGAANTLRRRDGRWEATNTDVEGFLDPLATVLAGWPEGLRASVLGAGGSARAVVTALQARGAAVTVHARRPEQAREVAEAFGATAGPWPPEAGSWDLLVNCTPLGGPGRRDESPVRPTEMTGRLVYDLTYGPGTSRLIQMAKVAGCLTLDGLPMLVAQAERQFAWWTGRPPDAGVMASAIR